jgi:hypothetical protein
VPDSWNPPTGPPNGIPVHPADAKREIEHAVGAARAHDQTLRARVAMLAAARFEAGARLQAATSEIEDAHALVKRALVGANEAARAGQRADAARLTGAAQVFAMRLRNARTAVAEWEAVVAASSAQRQELDAALAENVGRLRAVAAARLPMLGGRKAARSQALVDETVSALSVPVTDLVAQAVADARAELVAADEAASADDAVEVTVDDLEREVDYGGTDEILDELRVELGLPTAGTTPEVELEGEVDAAGPAAEAGTGHHEAGQDEASTPEVPPVPHASGARF